MTNLVYVIGSPETHRVKIGRTTDLEARLRRLQTTSPVPLDVIFLVPGSKTLEAALHGRFVSALMQFLRQAMIRSRNSPTVRSSWTASPLVVLNVASASAKAKPAAGARWSSGSCCKRRFTQGPRPDRAARRPLEEIGEPTLEESRERRHFAPLRTHGEWFDFEGLDAADEIHKAVATFTSQEFADAARPYTAEVQQHLSTLRAAAKKRELQRQRLREAIAREMLTNSAATVTTMSKYVPWSEETLRGIAREFDVPLKRPPTVRSIKDKPES